MASRNGRFEIKGNAICQTGVFTLSLLALQSLSFALIKHTCVILFRHFCLDALQAV